MRVSTRTALQHKRDRLQEAVEFLANLMIPKPQHNDPFAS